MMKAGKHRLLHVHRNVPGVLRKIWNALDDIGNVTYQTCMTTENIGYFLADVSENVSETAFARLDEIEETLRVRRLF